MRVTFSIIAVCVLVFLLPENIGRAHFLFDRTNLPQNFYTIITSIFAHGSVPHLLYNMLALFFFGTFLESLIGEKRFFSLFMITGVLANIFTIPFYTASLGASGAIYGVLGSLTVLKPKEIVYFNLFVPLPLIVATGIFLLLDVIGIFNPTGVGNLAHISGLLVGVLAGFYWRKYLKKPSHDDYIKQVLKS